MPDRTDGNVAAGTIKNEHTNKRGSVFLEKATPDIGSGSKASHSPPVASGTSARETSPKKRRKVSHGQNDKPRARDFVRPHADFPIPNSVCLLSPLGELQCPC